MPADARNAGDTALLASCSSLDQPRPLDLNGPVDRPFTPLPENAHDRSIFELFATAVARAPNAIALEDGEAKLSYGEVLQQASCLAQSIVRTVEPGEPVGIALPNGVKGPVAMLAALATGRPYVPLDISSPAERNALIVRQSGMRTVIVDDETSVAVRAVEGSPPLLDFASGIVDKGNAPLVASPDHVARVFYTSGSEGRPKGVCITQRSLLHQAAVRINVIHLTPDDRQILLFGATSAASQPRIWAPLLSGARIVMVDLGRKGLQEAVRVMAQRGITLFAAAPYIFRRLMELCDDPASVATIRNVNVSSDRVFASDVALFRKRFPESCLFSSSIATTEAGIYGSWFVPADLELDRPIMPVGYAVPGFEITVVDEQGQPVPRGEVGEIVVAGRYVSEGYWRDEALTRRAFTVDPNDPERRINRTGDLGTMRADGLIDLMGRKDRRLRVRGSNVEPAEVEAALRAHPAIRDATIIPRPAGDTIEIIAYATVRPEIRPPTQASLSNWLAQRLPQVMRPRRIYLVPALPLLWNFKPDIRKLEEFDRERAASEADAATARMQAPPAGLPVKEAVRSRWERVLGPGSFAANLSWQESGGDSLKALELIFALEEMLDRPVAMGLVGPDTRPSELIAALHNAGPHPPTPVTVDLTGQMRLFFLPGYSGLMFHDVTFLRALARHTSIEALEYPPVVPTRLGPVVFDDIVTHVVQAIRARQAGDERIGLLGYSFGGHVAFAAACRLKAEGIDLAYLGIVDISAPGCGHVASDVAMPEPPNGPHPPWLRSFRRLWTAVTLPRYAADRLVTIWVNGAHYARLAWLWRVLGLFGLSGAQARFRVTTMRLLRLRAQLRHVYERYPGQICLLYAADNQVWRETQLPNDLGWSDYCAAIEVCPVPGDHLGMLGPGNLDILTRAIVSQCERAGAI